MKTLKINKPQLEINKPSELTQTIFFKNNDCNAFASLTAMQMDMFNLIFYKSKEHFIRNNLEILEFMPFELDLIEFTNEFGKYKIGNYQNLIKQLVELSDVKVVINALGKNKDPVAKTTFTRFIHKIEISRHQQEKRKKVRLVLDGDICNMVLNVKKLFTKFYLKIQFSMVSKYSKLLYELLKDYEGIKQIPIDYQLLIGMLNVDFDNTNNGKWAMFNQNILSKAVHEINEKSDIRVSYVAIKERPTPKERLQVTKVNFFIEQQSEERLQELGLIQPSITSLPFYKKSKAKLDKLVNGGYQVIDEEMWIETDMKKNESRYEAESRLDVWLKETPQVAQNEVFKLIARSLDECDDISVYVEDYKVIGLFSKDTFTKNPLETIELLNNIVDSIPENTD